MFLEQTLAFIRESILVRTPFNVMNMRKLLNTITSFLGHFRIHIDKNPYECKECGKYFTPGRDVKYIKEFTLVKNLVLGMWEDF